MDGVQTQACVCCAVVTQSGIDGPFPKWWTVQWAPRGLWEWSCQRDAACAPHVEKTSQPFPEGGLRDTWTDLMAELMILDRFLSSLMSREPPGRQG